jgi:HEAT repeat protein
MHYQEITPISREEADREFASGKPDRIREALFSITHHDSDWRWVQGQCLLYAKHESDEVRRAAAQCLGSLARIHGTLDLDIVLPVLSNLLKDAKVGGYAEDALSDIRIFLPVTREEAQRAFASNSPEIISDTLLRIIYHDSDWRWVQGQCLLYAKHESDEVRRAAAQCLGSLALNRGIIDSELVIPVLNELVKDSRTAKQAEEALSSIHLVMSQDSL